MKTYIDKLTTEEEAQIASYRDQWIAKGLQTGETDFDTFDKYMPICYEKAKISYPKNIVRVSSPLVGALASAVAEGIWKKRRVAVGVAVGVAVDDAVGVAVDDAVGDAVRVAVGVAVGDAVRVAVGVAVDDAVDDAVGDAVSVAISIAKKAGVTLSWHYWIGGQFWVGGWYWGVAFANFFFDICKLKLSQDIMERAEAYRKVCESVNYIWANIDFVMVCARPVNISRNNLGRLHSDTRKSIEYPDGWGLYHLNGVLFPEALWKKVVSRKMPFKDIMAIIDVDQRTQAMKYGNFHDFANTQNAKMLDSYKKSDVNGDEVKYELWKFPKGDIFQKDVHFMWYTCPSTKNEYTSGVWESNTVAEAMSRKQGITEEMWCRQIPLVHES